LQGLVEFEVYGDELDESLARDAPIWLEGGRAMVAADEVQDEGGAVRGPLSYATDSDMSTSFVTIGNPAGLLDNDGLVIDLQDPHSIALVVVWQNATRVCTTCMLQKSLDGEAWEDIQLMVHTDGMVLAGFGVDAGVVARYIRFTVVEAMQTPWEITDLQVFGCVHSSGDGE
jgi:hypothetical protein